MPGFFINYRTTNKGVDMPNIINVMQMSQSEINDFYSKIIPSTTDLPTARTNHSFTRVSILSDKPISYTMKPNQ